MRVLKYKFYKLKSKLTRDIKLKGYYKRKAKKALYYK